MISQTATLTSKGQITIPTKIIKSANFQKGQKLVFSLKDGVVRLETAQSMVRRLAASLPIPPQFKGLAVDKLIRLSKEKHFATKKQ